ncbi:YidC/Oxa1 family membrane protein insertase [Algoriphagus alkaliphilus]|uniref:Membrane protein insertase YidC n=1 Tax=Algoriphagus alkaliphilus TaxID=279824 RepID=A0A1G5Y392_9BACT|nr:membrane protein insertase YidC [Algoriphagus alkaliphilus]MBA4301135.1 membrane protein insertase YidC [Cyclobacterium sp.]SDA76676.1 YidC/Oxa1 family membrane protein insertase [Algoriphagus alkaliphilus]
MDKNQATGLILFAAVILIYSLFFASSPEIPPLEQTPQETEAQTLVSPKVPTIEVLPDSLVDAQRISKYGALASLTVGEEENVILENDKVKITFSTKGAQIKEVILKEFKSWNMEPLALLDEKSSTMNFSLESTKGPIALSELYFNSNLTGEELDGVKTQVLTLSAKTESGSIIQKFTLSDGSFEVKKSLEIERFQGVFSGNAINFTWEDKVKAQEKDLSESRRQTQLNYYLASESYDNLGVGNDSEEEQLTEPVKWIGFSQRFFTAGIIADSVFQNVKVAQSTPADSSIVRIMSASFAIPLQNGKAGLSFYFGPDKYKTLKKVTDGFEKNVDMGYFFVSWVNKYIVVHLFEFLEKYFNNYGIIIILIVLIIKLALSPLTYKSYIGMAKMRVIKPEIDELKAKYGDDATKMQQEQMKLFSQLGVSPISGCLPLLLQMPFLFAMFFFFPNAVELRQESFLWANDLSTFDEFIKLPFTIPFYGSHVSLFTLLMTVSQIVYTHFNNQLTTVTGPMKNLGYIMPVMFMFILNSYPAGLSFYYFVSNVVTFGQQALIKLFVDDAKIRAKVEESKVKNVNKKKSKFQQKLEDAMKAADSNRKK